MTLIAETTQGRRGPVTTFTEQPPYKRKGGSAGPIVYRYVHESGNMTMTHPELYAAREIMARSESGQKAGAKPAKANDPDHARQVAEAHYARYTGDGMNYVQRYYKNRRHERG